MLFFFFFFMPPQFNCDWLMSMHSLPNLSHYGACWEIMRFCPHLGLMLAVLYHTTGPSAAAWGVESEQNHHHKKKKKKRKANSCVYAKWRNYDWFFLFGFYFFLSPSLWDDVCCARLWKQSQMSTRSVQGNGGRWFGPVMNIVREGW